MKINLKRSGIELNFSDEHELRASFKRLYKDYCQAIFDSSIEEVSKSFVAALLSAKVMDDQPELGQLSTIFGSETRVFACLDTLIELQGDRFNWVNIVDKIVSFSQHVDHNDADSQAGLIVLMDWLTKKSDAFDIDTPGSNGVNLLAAMVNCDLCPMYVQTLLNAGANPKFRLGEYGTPLHFLSIWTPVDTYREKLSLLIALGADIVDEVAYKEWTVRGNIERIHNSYEDMLHKFDEDTISSPGAMVLYKFVVENKEYALKEIANQRAIKDVKDKGYLNGGLRQPRAL